MPREEWPEEVSAQCEKENWQPPFFDRRQELVLIGVDLDEGTILKALESCLLSDEEMEAGPPAWMKFKDPFPVWELEEDVA